MKRIIFVLFALLIGIVAFSQAQVSLVAEQTLTAVTVNGTGTATVTLPAVNGEYDISLQLMPALAGAGDSVDYNFVLYQSNARSGDIWSILQTTKAVTSVTDADALSNLTNFQGLRLKAIITGVSTDTITVTPYYVIKKLASE